MTIVERLMGYLTIIAKERMDDRIKFVYRDYTIIVATTEDLRDALDLMGKVGSRIRPYLLDWFNDYFIPTFDDNPHPNEELRKGEKNVADYVLREKRQGLSTNQIIEVMKNKGEYISVDDLRHKYLYPLINQGYDGHQDSVLDGRQAIYFPTGNHEIDIFAQGSKLKVDFSVYPTLERIRESFTKIRRYGDTVCPKIVFKNKEIETAE